MITFISDALFVLYIFAFLWRQFPFINTSGQRKGEEDARKDVGQQKKHQVQRVGQLREVEKPWDNANDVCRHHGID